MIIQLNHIYKTYNKGKSSEQPVLKRCSLKIENGKMTAITGKSGTGKSTLLHIIGLVDCFDEGSYLLDGKEIRNQPEKNLAKLRNQYFGYVMQDFALIQHMRVYDNIAVPLYIANQKQKEISDKIIKIAGKLGIGNLLENKIDQLSGGQKQRTAIARALVNDPTIILADEPTGALDVETGNEILHIFKDLKNTGKTIIIVTHDSEIAAACDSQLYMKDGKIL